MTWALRIIGALAGLAAVAWLAAVAYAYWPGGEEVPARTLADPGDRFVRVNGLEVRYRTWGTPADGRPTALLIHGFANSLQSFRLLAPALANDYYVVAFDLPGYGLSSKPADHDYRNPAQAQFTGSFIRALDLRDVVVCGHSLGGAIALRVAVSEPGIAGLVLLNPGIISTGVPALARYLFFPLPRVQARLFGDPEFRRDFLRRSFVDPSIVTDQVIADLARTSRSEGYLAGMTHLMGQYQPASESALLASVRVPALIVWGARDRGKPAGEFEELRSRLPHGEAVLVPTAGHYVHEEAPRETADAMNRFAARL